jgi:hypothetical protein
MKTFLIVHQDKKPRAIDIDSVKLIYPALKGHGSLIITDQEDHDLSVDETFNDLIRLMTGLGVTLSKVA